MFIVYCSLFTAICSTPATENKDTLRKSSDTLKKNQDKDALKSKVKYNAKDSIVVDIKNEKIYLFGTAEIHYEKINIKAAYIEVDFGKNEMFASGLKDSTGKLAGTPIFSEESETFTSDNMTYNFKNKKGIIRHIKTKEGEGFLLGNKVKKMPDNIVFLNSGSYTTCDLDDPHYEIRFIHAKVMPDNKIVSGPAMMFIEGIPTPLFVPFGYFPVNKGRKSGIIIPSYGNDANRGFYLENGGYYWGINDYRDLCVKGNIYANGSWALMGTTDYNRLYHYSGSLSLNYAINKVENSSLPGTFNNEKDFFIRWMHNQSDKARPNSHFSADVNISSTKYNQYNPTSTADYLTNTFESSISYSTVIGNEFNLSLNGRHSQNTQTHVIDITLPELTLSANRFYPFQKKERIGNPKWYENISINYLMDAKNELSGPDSTLFKKNLYNKMNNGITHSVPISSSIKLLKHLTWSNTINYKERWYFKSIKKDSIGKTLKVDTINGFNSERDFSFSSNISTRLYGMYQFKHGYIRAIRHVITPTIGFYYTPYFSQYYNSYTGPVSKKDYTYSKFEGSLYGNAPSAKSGSINFSVSNNLEMKVRSKKDTVTGLKKIILIEDLTFAESYDLAKDSLQWSRLSISGHTKLFKNIDLKYSSLFDPYVSNEFGRQNKFEWDVNHQLYNMQSTQWALSVNWNLNSNSKSKNKSQENTSAVANKPPVTNPLSQNIIVNPNGDGYVDFNVPWNLNLYYTFLWTSQFDIKTDENIKTLVQTLAFNGDVNLTKKWKVGLTSGFDIQNHQFSYTSVNIYRDLHCWEMVFNWIPNGQRKSYNFTIRVKASVLKDLKLMKKTNWADRQY